MKVTAVAAPSYVDHSSLTPLHRHRQLERMGLVDYFGGTEQQPGAPPEPSLASQVTTSPPTAKPTARPTRAPTTEPTSTDGALPRRAVELAVAAAAFFAYLVI